MCTCRKLLVTGSRSPVKQSEIHLPIILFWHHQFMTGLRLHSRIIPFRLQTTPFSWLALHLWLLKLLLLMLIALLTQSHFRWPPMSHQWCRRTLAFLFLREFRQAQSSRLRMFQIPVFQFQHPVNFIHILSILIPSPLTPFLQQLPRLTAVNRMIPTTSLTLIR